jgi:hypothetical protein
VPCLLGCQILPLGDIFLRESSERLLGVQLVYNESHQWHEREVLGGGEPSFYFCSVSLSSRRPRPFHPNSNSTALAIIAACCATWDRWLCCRPVFLWRWRRLLRPGGGQPARFPPSPARCP